MSDVKRSIPGAVAWIALAFAATTALTWGVLHRMVPPAYVSFGIVEIGYFNPRDYLPHPLVSTRGIAAVIVSAPFAREVATLLGVSPAKVNLRAAPLEEGLLRIEARAADPFLAWRAASVACSLVVETANEGFVRERALLQRHVETIRRQSAAAESLAHDARADDQARAQAFRALAHFTEIQVKAETEAELLAQKKETRVMSAPGHGTPERPPLAVVAMGPAALVALLVAAALLRRPPP